MSFLQQAFTRFDTLYSLLVKQKVKSSAAGQTAVFQNATNQASKQKQRTDLEQMLTMKDRIQIIATLAKSEVCSLPESTFVAFLSEVTPETDQLCQKPFSSDFNEREQFVLCLFVRLARTTNQLQFATELLCNLIVRAQQLIQEKATIITNSESAADYEISLNQDNQLQSQLDFILYIQASILKSDLKHQGLQTLQIFNEAQQSFQKFLQDHNADNEDQKYFKLTKFATEAIWFKVLLSIFAQVKTKSSSFFDVVASKNHQGALKNLLDVTFNVLGLYKANSKFFMTQIGSNQLKMDAESGEQITQIKTVRRMTTLFSEILDLLVHFAVSYLTTLESPTSCQVLFNILIVDEESDSSFTLVERLSILKELNFLFCKIKPITDHSKYWSLIREGLQDVDQASRKIALAVLKENLKYFDQQKAAAQVTIHCTEKEFEQLWTTFFDVFDTLESFGSHLIKAVWQRIDVFYDFIQAYADKMTGIDKNGNAIVNQLVQLEDFRTWLFVLYNRVSSHTNLKIRRFVQKATLQRKFITEQMREFYFGEFISILNQGLIFKDQKTIYTQFSKNSQQVHDFYMQFFLNESTNLTHDLRMLFLGMSRIATHHQTFLICLRLLGTSFGKAQSIQWLGSQELQILERTVNNGLVDLYFSNRYLCKKYLLKLVANYVITPANDPNFDWKILFKIIGQMPVEFFSPKTLFIDKEGLDASVKLVEVLGRDQLQNAIHDYLVSLFTIKALPDQMPKFGQSYELIVTGISNAALILLLICEEPVTFWFLQTMNMCLETFDQMMESTYLSNKLVEGKIQCLEIILSHVYTYGNENFRKRLRSSKVVTRITPVLSRFNDNLYNPLSRKECLTSEIDKIEAAFGNLKSYVKLVGLSIKMFHLHERSSHNALQAFIKSILSQSLKVTQGADDKLEQTWAWGKYLQQHVTFSVLSIIYSTYSTGIQESIKNGIDHFYVPDEIFQFGQPLLKNLIDFKPQMKPNGSEETLQDQKNFLFNHDTSLLKINQHVLIDTWKVISDTIHIFQFDPQLKDELFRVSNDQIASKAIDFLTEATEHYNASIFKVLKLSFLPTIISKLNQQEDESDIRQTFESLQKVFMTCWKIVKDLRTDITAETLQEFIEITFAHDLIEAYQRHLNNVQLFQSLIGFHNRLAQEVLDHADKYWLILRGFFNHLMFTFATRPHLMQTFEPFILNFALARELRSLDSEIKLYKLQTMLPQIIPSELEDLPMELITFQGAYIRTMTLIVVEGIIKQHLFALKQVQSAPGFNGVYPHQIESITTSLEELLRQSMLLNFSDKRMKKCEQPYGEGHRLKVRNWQFMLVLLQLLDPTIYTESYRKHRVDQGHADIVAETILKCWDAIKQNNLASIRQYIEVFIIKIILKFPDIALSDPKFIQTMLDPKISKPQVSASLLMIVGQILTSDLNTQNSIVFKKKIFENLLGFITSNSAHSRCITQYYLMKLQKDKQFGAAFMPTGIQPILNYLNGCKDVARMQQKYDTQHLHFQNQYLDAEGVKAVLCCNIDKDGEFITEPFVNKLRSLFTEIIGDLRKEDLRPQAREDYWKLELDRKLEEEGLQLQINEQTSTNYQRKILPWEQIEFDQSNQERVFKQRKRNQIIMCASLIDKIPNLAGLARTSEIMNASSLIIDRADITELEEFKGISVTSEKWLPIYEVREKDLLNYLHYQKSNGYTILGIEQTANSKMLNEYKFPTKCILLLGKEKEGIPQEYYGILDQCIEIPQFGIIRSLNVHVSGALCLWEYTKQRIAAKKDS